MSYSNAKLAILLVLLQNGPPIAEKVRSFKYENDRNPGVATISDASRLTIGRHSLVKQLQCLRRVKFKWTKGINDHVLRIELKKTFYKLTKCFEN